MTDSLYSGRPLLNKDTSVCISLAARPSNIGTRFHNYLYNELGLDFVYKAFTTTDIAAAIGGVRALGIRGCSVSMPFKEDVIALVDELEESARVINSVNTIVNDAGRLTACNTDYLAIARLIDEHGLSLDGPASIRVEARSAVIYKKPVSIIEPDYVWAHTDKWINFPWSTLPVIKP